jgi:homoserine dehydrogenase
VVNYPLLCVKLFFSAFTEGIIMKIMLIGFGTVGQGLLELLQDKAESLQTEQGFAPKIVAVATGSRGILYNANGLSIPALLATRGRLSDYLLEAERDFANALDLIQSKEADVVIEVTPTNLDNPATATAHCQAAIASKKHIVTANKGPIAKHYNQLMNEAKTAGVEIRFEATVMAGTPCIAMGRELLSGAKIHEARGIVNGTTNYILSQMESGLSYESALKQAQELGYAETDPTADVEGWDAAAKVLILLAAFFGKEASLNDLSVTGITSISQADIESAKAAGERYKLIASITPEGGSVKPIRLPITDPLSQVSGAMNAISFDTDVIGNITLIGKGAGAKETGFAILSDLLALHRKNL